MGKRIQLGQKHSFKDISTSGLRRVCVLRLTSFQQYYSVCMTLPSPVQSLESTLLEQKCGKGPLIQMKEKPLVNPGKYNRNVVPPRVCITVFTIKSTAKHSCSSHCFVNSYRI